MQNFKSAQVLPFFYVVQATLGATVGATATVNLTTDSASYFELHQIGGSSSLDADTDFMPNNFTLKISEQSTGRDLTGGQIPQRCICGPANQGWQFRRLVNFPPNTTFQFTVVNTIATANVVDIVLHGFKLYQLT
jgi:hypothetical protein